MKKLEDTFQKLGFEVATCHDLSSFELKARVNELAQQDFFEHGCLVVCLLSHGRENAIACSDGNRVNINKLKYEFALNKCPSLYGKPKIFIVQACQGGLTQDETGIVVPREKRAKKRSRSQSPISPSSVVQMSPEEAIANYEPITLLMINNPNNPPIMDLFTMKSAIPGFGAYRISTGSFFIQALCEKMEDEYCSNKIETRPLQNILWDVQDLVSKECRKLSIFYSKKYHKSINYRQTIMSEDYVKKFIKFKTVPNPPTIFENQVTLIAQ